MKKLLAFLLAFVMLAAAFALLSSAADVSFSDVEEGRWSAVSVQYAVDNGYMKGVGGGKFDPEGTLTRAMVATVLWRREGEPGPSAASGFTDVPAGEWYTNAVAWAKESGVVKGLSVSTFGPDEFITREQLAAMLYRFSNTKKLDVVPDGDLTVFSDSAKISSYAGDPLSWAVGAGLIRGVSADKVNPGGNATREQFAAILERFDKAEIPTLRDVYSPITEQIADCAAEMLDGDLEKRETNHSYNLTGSMGGAMICGLSEAGRTEDLRRYIDGWRSFGDPIGQAEIGLVGYGVEELYERTHEEKYADLCREILEGYIDWPVTVHGQIKYDADGESTDIYVDGTGMTTMFIARYSALFGDLKVSDLTTDENTYWYRCFGPDMTLSEIARLQVSNYLKLGLQPRSLYVYHGYHGGGSGVGEMGWGRGTGWLMLAIGSVMTYCPEEELNRKCETFINKTFTYLLPCDMFAWSLSEKEGASDTSGTGMILWGTIKAKEAGYCDAIDDGLITRVARACLNDVRNGEVWGGTEGSPGFGYYGTTNTEHNGYCQGAVLLFYAALVNHCDK